MAQSLRHTRSSTVPLRDEASLNIIIPMGGSDEAFREAGYTAPKPMIKLAGRSMLLHLLDSLRLRLGDVVWLILPSVTYLKFQSQLDLNAEYPDVDIRICTFTCQTRGAVETIYIGLQHMTPAELSRRTLCLDCDTLYFSDVLSMYRSSPPNTGMCAYFVDRGTAALYSYLQLNEDGFVTEVSEKKATSNLANIGAYGFSSGTQLRSFIQDVLDAPEGNATEYFLSNVINRMLARSHPFVANLAEDCAQCGTPAKLEQFMEQVAAGKALTQPKRRFCFALDNVLVTPPEHPGDYSTVSPIEKNIQLVRELKASGHHIIITTSRLMQEKGGNIGAVVAACGNQTLRTLETLDIPYDEIHFGQPFAHVYVDASVACSALDTEKNLGWRIKGRRETLEPGMVAARHFNNVQLEGDYVVKTASQSVLRGEIFFYEHMPTDIAHFFPHLVSAFNAPPPSPSGSTSPRKPDGAIGTNAAGGGGNDASVDSPDAQGATANDASIGQPGGCQPCPAAGSSVLPSAPTPSCLPTSVPSPALTSQPSPASMAASPASLVPKPPLLPSAALTPAPNAAGSLTEMAELDGADAAATAVSDGISSLTLSRIKGVTFSHLVTNRSLTPGRLILLLKALRKLHSSPGDPASLRPAEPISICANYLPKLRKRYQAHRDLYSRLSTEADSMYAWLDEQLTSFESEGRWQHAPVIHGDPVFSNVLLTDDGRIYLLDMRGELGNVLTLQGDLTYDLSKVYQSLLGYDYIILSQPLLERDAELLEELRNTFRTFIKEHYPSVAMTDIIKITASHYFGIVPLHVNREHQLGYLNTAQALISSCPHQQ